MSSFAVRGVGKAVPERVVTNTEIGDRLGVDAEWISSRTGIRERRFAGPGDSASSLGAQAARGALATSGTDPSEVGAIIVATCTPDYVFPPTATLIQAELGIPSVAAFDISAACSGFVYALQTAAALAQTGAARKVLVVGVDLLSRHLNLDDPVTAPLFGDGAGAALIEADPSGEQALFEMGSDGTGAQDVIVPGSGSKLFDQPAEPSKILPSCIRMSGREVYRRAVKTMTDQGARLGKDGFDMLIAHQANRRILDECAAQLGVGSEKVFMNIQRYGNTSAGSVPIAMCEAWEQGLLKPGNRVLLLGFGAGYTWGGALFRWTMASPADVPVVQVPESDEHLSKAPA